jgi:DUF1009 family protein
MSRRVAVISGTGDLPMLMVAALESAGTPYLLAELEGFTPLGIGTRGVEVFRLERLVPFLDRLEDLGVTEVVFAGAVRRPRLDPVLIDPATAQMLPRILNAMQAGDDATLREVIAIFEDAGFAVIGADDVAPDLLAAPAVLGTCQPTALDAADAARAALIVAALGAVDVGQGAVVARGLCLAVEALPGTDAMLAQVAQLRRKGDRGGVFFKAPKPGQERRVDLPALGPDTLRAAHLARLGCVVFEAGGVMLLHRAEMIALADELGLVLWARQP